MRTVKRNLPINLKYLLTVPDSPFNLEKIRKENYDSKGIIMIPDNFSILDNPDKSYEILKQLISALLIEDTDFVYLNYQDCHKIELSTQILVDIILLDFFKLARKSYYSDRNRRDLFPREIGGININDKGIQKMLFSVGSPAVLKVRDINFPDIVKYELCVHDNNKERDPEQRMAQKELDTSIMADYVINCLSRMNKKLTSEKLNDLCTVIGEILINAEEHSSTQYRFSIGYFKEENEDNNHYGIFRLVILNFGRTIYEKFKVDDCPNKDIVERMKQLSKNYTKRSFFSERFEEESLWTLYALQEGVTSVSHESFKRGNGSIRFIESFFNIKGTKEADDISRMSILSGRTRIAFDGKYNIVSKTNTDEETFKVMTFNDSGNIEDKPDSDYVYCTDHYFPGTMISARILLNDDDIKQINS